MKLSFVIVIAEGSYIWDDGIERVLGPFSSFEEANDYAKKNKIPLYDVKPIEQPKKRRIP